MVRAPVEIVEAPKPHSRIESTPQLVVCSILLSVHSASVPSREISDDEADDVEAAPEDQPATHYTPELVTNTTRGPPTETSAVKWIKAIEHDQVEQGHIHWLISQMVEEFIKNSVKDSSAISEIVLLGPVLDRELYRMLLSCLITEFGQSVILDVDLLQGLVQLVQCASPGYLVPDDLVKILSILRIRLQGVHQQTAEHPYHLTLAVSRVLDVMAEHGVEDLDRVLEHEPLSNILSTLKDMSDPYLMYQASHAFQALQFVPNDESALEALKRYSVGITDNFAKVAAVTRLDLGSVLKGLENLQKTLNEGYEAACVIYNGVSELLDAGQSIIEILCGGSGYGHKRLWYSALLAGRELAQQGQLAELNQLICQAPCRRDPLFQWGICQLLGEIASDPMWTSAAREQAIDLLEELFRNDTNWGQDRHVENWMLTIIRKLSESSDETIQPKALALLQDLNIDTTAVLPHPYPLRSRLPRPATSSILADVQNIPYVEYDLHKLRQQRLQLDDNHQAVYIPPQAKASLQARDSDLFPLMEKVQEFLASERQVMLILGDSGAGKSIFNRHLELSLWSDYKNDGPIPLHINLPAIDRPDQDMIGKHLKMCNFTDTQIKEMKQHRQFILICDGYDESQQTENLHRTNLFNQPSQWTAKMIISCRSQYLGQSYHTKFKPQPMDRYNSNSVDLFQEAVIAPFSKDQVKGYVKQFSSSPKAQRLFGNRPIWSSEEYMEKLTAVPNLMDLVRNPFLLALSLTALPSLVDSVKDLSSVSVTRVCLFDKCVEQFLETNLQRLQESKLSTEDRATLDLLVEDGFISRSLKYLERLSASIFKEQDGHPIVQYSPLSDAGTWKAEMFGPDPVARLLREVSPITRTGNQHRFLHRSVLEYFYSRVIFAPALEDVTLVQQDTSDSSAQVPFDTNGPLFQSNLSNEPSIIQFLCDRVQQNSEFKQKLLAIIELSKSDPSASQAAANGITILVKAGVHFNGADFRGVQIPGADLSDGQFDYAQFRGANLKGANFTRSWLRRADFSKAQMDDIHFGELPYLRTSSHAHSCAFSFDGTLLAVGLYQDGIVIYDTATWKKVHTLEVQQQFVLSLAYSPNSNQHIVSGGSDSKVRLWDSVKRRPLFVMAAHTGYVLAVAFSPSGEHIASASSDKTVCVWSALTGHPLLTLEGHSTKVTGLAYSPSGKYLVSGCDEGTIRLWRTKTGALDAVWPSSNASAILCLAHSPDGQWIATGHKGGEIELRSVKNGELSTALIGHTSRVRGIAFSPNSQWIVSASRDHTVRLWDVSTGTLVSVFSGHNAVVTAATFSPDGLQVASASEDYTVRLWEVSSSAGSTIDMQHGHTGSVSSVAYSPDGLSIVSCSQDQTIRQWDASTGIAGPFFLRPSSRVQVVAYSPSGEHITTAGTDDYNITLWNSQTCTADAVFSGHTGSVSSLAYSSCGRSIVSTSRDKTARLWDTTTLARIETGYILASTQTSEIQAAAFSPRGTRFVTAGIDDAVQLWDVETREVLATLQGCGKVNFAVAFSPNGGHIAVGGLDERLHLWDGESATPGAELRGHSDRINCVAYSADGLWIATGSTDKTVRLWRCKDDKLSSHSKWTCVSVVTDFSGPIRSIAWSPTSPLEFVTGCDDHSVRVWRLVVAEGGTCVCLVWGSNIGQLVALDLSTKDAIGLSSINRDLLVQRGAVDESH
ncbi:hypothetical protein EC991_008511 [Linnemannia zychae]|nr:hypothetical protein EC991_008511 [Linnemannia zychae]